MNEKVIHSKTPTADIFRIYDRFGNLFKMNYTEGTLYRFETNPVERIGPGKTIFFQGVFYCYESSAGAQTVVPDLPILKRMITRQFALALKRNDYRFKGRYRAYKLENEISHSHRDIFSVHEGFEFRTVIVEEQMFLCVDPHIVFGIKCSIEDLVSKGIKPEELNDCSVSHLAEDEERRIAGYLLETVLGKRDIEPRSSICRIKNYRDFAEVLVPAKLVFPETRPELIQELLSKLHRNYDVIRLQRRLSFLDSRTASRDRLLKTMEIIRQLQKDVFPLEFGEFEVNIEAEPIVVRL